MAACVSWGDKFMGNRIMDPKRDHRLFAAPRRLQACAALTQKGAFNPNAKDAQGTVRMLHLYRGRASAQHIGRILVDTEEIGKTVLDMGGGVAKQYEICQAFGKAPHPSVAGASLVSAFNEAVQADLLLQADRPARYAPLPGEFLVGAGPAGESP